jgi:hypothetical protein
MCPGAGPIISVQMFPEDSLAGSGEVKLIASYDLNQDGNFDQTVQASHVGGMCGDGFIANCSPHGSWRDCKFYKWYFNEGEIIALDYDPAFSENENQRTISLADLHGCFCFNRSCNNAIRKRKSQVLSYFASGIMDIMRRVNNEIVITKVEDNESMMTLDYIGANISDCHTNKDIEYQSSSVQQLTNLSNSLDFNEELAVSNAPSDSAFGVLSSAHSNTAGGENYTTYQCEIESKVNHRLEVKTRDPKISCEKVKTDPSEPVFDIVDPDTIDGHWYHPHGKSKFVLAHNEMMRVSIDPSYCEPLNFMWTTVEVKCGDTWVTIRQVDGYYLNVSNSCSGGRFDSIDVNPRQYLNLIMNHFSDIEWWPKYKYECDGAGNEKCLSANDLCRCVITDDIFTCYSPSMGPNDGSVIINNDSNRGYNKILFQGCEEIKDPENGCTLYENDPDCTLVSEITDGIPTMSGGVLTNAESIGSCRLIEGDARSITVCEPWWKKVRQYRCLSSLNFNYENVKKRTKYVGKNIGYNNGDWSSQGDMRFSADGSSNTIVFDPDLQFNTNIKSHELSCLISYESENTDLMIDGLDTTSFNSTRTIYESRVCEENNGVYICPHDEEETVENPCSKFDDKSFATAIAGLTTLRNAPSDMICSSGEKQGMCDPEDLGKPAKQIVCYTNPTYDASADLYNGEVEDCIPNTWWRKTPLQDQTHRIYATEDYRCRAEYPGLSEGEGEADTDYFENDLGEMIPLSAWFDPVVEWAKPLIIEHLKSDPEFIPDPGPDCPCVGGNATTSVSDGEDGSYDCEWTVETSVGNINRQDDLLLDADSDTPFGDVELFFSRIGSWGGSHSVACIFQEAPRPEQSGFPDAKCRYIAKDDTSCTSSCPSTISIILDTGYVSKSKANVRPTRETWTQIIIDGSVYEDRSQTNELYFEFSGSTTVIVKYFGDDLNPTRRPLTIKDGDGVTRTILPSYGGQLGEVITINISKRWNTSNKYCYASITTSSNKGASVSTNIKLCPLNETVAGNCQRKNIPMSEDTEQCGWRENPRITSSNAICKVSCTCSRYQCTATAYNGNTKIGSHQERAVLVGFSYKFYYKGCGSYGDLGKKCWPATRAMRNRTIERNCENPWQCDGNKKYYLNENTCLNNCQSKWTGYVCNINNKKFANLAQCQAGCVNTETYICPDGTSVSNPSDCKMYFCPLDGKYYNTKTSCDSQCSEPVSCNAQSDDYRFETTIKNPGSNIYSQELDLVSPQNRHIASAPYNHEDLILQQCVDYYFRSFVNFDDTPTSLHFDHKLADFLIYAAASIVRKEIPVGSKEDRYPGRLPIIPPVYTANYGDGTE